MKLKKKSHERTPNIMREDALVAFLSLRGDKWVSMEETTDSISLYPAFFREHYHNSTARRMLSFDIEQINRSDRYDKIIMSDKRGIKLASNPQEAEAWINVELTEIFQKLARVRCMMRKLRRNQQITLEGRICEAFLQEGGKDG